jgi:hypothetical protein
VVVRYHRRRGEVASEEFYCSFEKGNPGRTAPELFGFTQRGEFPEKQIVWFFLWQYSKYAEHFRTPVISPSGILFTQSTMWVFCSVGNPPSRGIPRLNYTRTDEILKKFKFTMNFK